MKCDKCDKEAVVHEIVTVGGKLVEQHLCEVHAGEVGIQAAGQQLPVHELFKLSLAHATPTTRQILACKRCGTSYGEFQKAGLLGCAACYEAFEARLGPLLERAHEGALHHVGKVPSRCKGGAPSRPGLSISDRARLLRARLEQAVHKEDYEEAAKLRDELSHLTGRSEPES